MDLSFDHAAFSGQVPLFPLPGAVLLPGALLPLHVFEPRYRAMVKDALAGERLIGMALLRPGYEADYEGCPEIEAHVCVGRILLEEPLADGKWNILLVGLRRARILDEDHSRPYRLARVEVLEDEPPIEEVESVAAGLLRRLLTDVPEVLVRDESRRELVSRLLEVEDREGLGLGTLVDLTADLLDLGVQDRQALLGVPDVQERLAALLSLVQDRMRQLEEARRATPWPPKFSAN